MGIAASVTPQDGTRLVREFARKRPVDANESVLNELLYLVVAERAHQRMFIGRHEYPHIALGRSPIVARCNVGAADLVQECRTAGRLPSTLSSSARAKQAPLLTAEEEDRSDIGCADHHDDLA